MPPGHFSHGLWDNFNCPPGAAASCDVNGKPMPFRPDWKGSVRVKYVQSLGSGLSVDYVLGKNLFNQSYATLVQNSGNHINRCVPRD